MRLQKPKQDAGKEDQKPRRLNLANRPQGRLKLRSRPKLRLIKREAA